MTNRTKIPHAHIEFEGELIATSDNRSDFSPFWTSLSLFRLDPPAKGYLLVEEFHLADVVSPTYWDAPPPRTSLHADLDNAFASLSNHDIVQKLRDTAQTPKRR